MDKRLGFLICLGIANAALSHADVTLNPLFTDHVVLQRDLPVPVWGTAAPHEPVSVELSSGESARTQADADGRWLVKLPPLKTSAKPVTMKVRGYNELTVHDVLIGEVWIGSGQSNMVMQIGRTLDRERVMAAAAAGKFPHIRLFKVPARAADEPTATVDASWSPVTSETIADFSATLFYYGEGLAEALSDVPIGLIQSSVGATNADCWISNEVMAKHSALTHSRETLATLRAELSQRQKAFEEDSGKKDKALQEESKPVPSRNRRDNPQMRATGRKRPTGLYNGMIAPLMPFAIRGVIWYQGENDAMSQGYAENYEDVLTALITSWRSAWAEAAGDPQVREFPFYIVQLANFRKVGIPTYWSIVREAQTRVSEKIPASGIVILLGSGESKDIHPRDKKTVGTRLAALARTKTYGESPHSARFSAPTFRSLRIDGAKAVVEFDTDGSKLVSHDGKSLRNFYLSGSDRKFYPANASIDGDRVIVRSAEVTDPVAVRYAWCMDPYDVNFYSSEEIPVGPFRSDVWETAEDLPSP